MSLQGDVSEGICICITLRSMTIRYVRLVTYSSRKRNSIKKSQLDRIENGHRRGPATGLSQSLGIIIKKKEKFSFLSTCRLPVEYLTDGRKLNLSEIRFKYISRQCRHVRSIQFLSGYVTELWSIVAGPGNGKEKKRKGRKRKEEEKKGRNISFACWRFPTSSLPDCSISNPPTFHLFLTFEIRGFIVSNFFFCEQDRTDSFLVEY